jgi:hypothetical protein
MNALCLAMQVPWFKFYERKKSRNISLHILVNANPLPNLDGPMKERKQEEQGLVVGREFVVYTMMKEAR